MRVERGIRLGRRFRLAPMLSGFGLLLTVLAMAGHADAAARSEVGINGRTVIVEGGTSHSVASAGRGHVIDVDGLKIQVEPGSISINGETRTLPEFQELKIEVDEGQATITADGKPL